MNDLEQIKKRIGKGKARQRTIFISIFILFAAIIVFSGVFLLREYNGTSTLRLYTREVPVFVEGLKKEMETQQHAFESDALSRGELGLKFYQSDLKPSDSDSLEWVCSMCLAESVSLVDRKGNIIKTTGLVTPDERQQDLIQSLKPRTPVVDIYSVNEGGQETSDGNVLVMIPVSEKSEQNMLFEFACEPLLKVSDDLANWPNTIFNLFKDDEIVAFLIEDQKELKVYPKDAFNEQERSQLSDELNGELQDINRLAESRQGLMTLLGKVYYTTYQTLSDDKVELIMAMPIGVFIGQSIFAAIKLLGFIATNIIIFCFYVVRSTQNGSLCRNKKEYRGRIMWKALPGFCMMLAATVCITILSLMLGQKSIIARDTMKKRTILQDEINWHEKQMSTISDVCSNLYRTRTEVAAKLMKDPAYKTRKGLKELSDITQTDYLMLFDKEGYQTVSSNSYTGFSVTGENANLGEEYQAMLLGYPSVVVGPEKDPHSKKMQISVATLLTEDDGTSDGFLLAVFGTDELDAVLANESLESTVMNFSTAEIYIAAVVNQEKGQFIAHSDPFMIGRNAVEVLDESVLAGNYEGFTKYGGDSAYVSAFMTGGKSYMVIYTGHANKEMMGIAVVLIIVLMILELFEYLLVYKVCEVPIMNLKKRILRSEGPAFIFLHGYAAYITLVAAVAYIATTMGAQTSFSFIFEGQWSRGVHLFSLWAAMFIISTTFCIVGALRRMLSRLEKSFNHRGRTIVKMVDNVVCYLTGFFLIFLILYLFGVKSVVLIAAASSIAMAFSFGARNLTADFLSGAFIIVENSVHVGDKVRIDGTVGHITNMGLRTIEVTDEKHNVIIINNSQVSRIVNMSNNISTDNDKDGENKETTIENKETAAENKETTAENKELTAENKETTAENKELTAENKELAAENKELAGKNTQRTPSKT